MNTTISTRGLLLVSLMAAAGFASAQVPNTTKAGEATTMQNGKPNAPDKSPMTSDTTRAEVKSEASAKVNSPMGNTTGEATRTGAMGQPGTGKSSAMEPQGTKSSTSVTRDQKRQEGRMASKNAPMGAEMAK